ncbi:hypothetical protein F4810DRAFT_242602 [Camillea tinctor]|nr:hypothetical protein F4810DRAFT_242602 [Camillea tinctor]
MLYPRNDTYIQSSKNTGRVVISINPRDTVPKLIKDNVKWGFPGDATYVIVGGFGGVGCVIVKWMARKGAKSLIILLRSGPTSKEASELSPKRMGC